ncbi:hypothetical protein WJX81_001897 [Elliptochloris bilobata]|uniref:Nudix hydrolase domain-containing protein n=1 Tax=Elliptochloris bilobata TaxID=381761 RepID=A0AAW1QDW2_9CHLO
MHRGADEGFSRSYGGTDMTGVEKLGAGLFLVSNRSVLLLQRRSKHNDNKWGLPGGNTEEADASLLDTAKREAAEEMGNVPDFAVTGVVETRRGKSQQKRYDVFVGDVGPEARAAFVPRLNDEHRNASWWPLEASQLQGADLHPVVAAVLAQPLSAALAAALPHWAAQQPLQEPVKLAAGGSGKKKAFLQRRGAGVLYGGEGMVLLVRTVGRRNNEEGDWRVPGADVDMYDADLAAVAARAAERQLGAAPAAEDKGSIVIQWGKRKARLFTVYLRSLAPGARSSFKPELAHLLAEYHWVAPSEAGSMPGMHPLAAQLLAQHAGELLTAFS